MRTDSAIERVNRILDLLPLLKKREMKFTELVSLTGVDADMIRHDLEVAFLCGLPGYTPDLLIDIHLDEEVASVLDAQTLDQPRKLAPEELSLLFLGLDMVELWLHQSTSITEALTSLRAKLTSQFTTSIWRSENQAKDVWATIEDAILKRRDVTFDYIDTLGRSTSDRTVVPLQLRVKRGQPMLEAFDRAKADDRVFFLGAMTNLRIIETESDPLPQTAETRFGPRLCTMKLRSVPRWWLRRHSTFIRKSKENETGVELELEYWSDQWLIRAFLPIADHIVGMENEHLSEEAFRRSLLSHFTASSTPVDG